MDFQQWMQSVLTQVEQALATFLPSEQTVPAQLHQAMRYAALAGGKRVRPLLCFAAGELVNASQDALLVVACAVEMIHVYSLVHDDMPCMDDDEMRRGRPTVHVKYDQATALLVGDALQTQAFLTLANEALSFEQRAKISQELALRSGSLGMAGGQAIDLASVGLVLDREALEQMHRMKTGALLHASVNMGLLAGQSAPQAMFVALETYASAIGLAFQVVDDILDVTADSTILGKTAGKDEQDGKPTYVSILGLDASKALAQALCLKAHQAVAPFSHQAQRLIELADFIINRVY